jgi:hypothetical protein
VIASRTTVHKMATEFNDAQGVLLSGQNSQSAPGALRDIPALQRKAGKHLAVLGAHYPKRVPDAEFTHLVSTPSEVTPPGAVHAQYSCADNWMCEFHQL